MGTEDPETIKKIRGTDRIRFRSIPTFHLKDQPSGRSDVMPFVDAEFVNTVLIKAALKGLTPRCRRRSALDSPGVAIVALGPGVRDEPAPMSRSDPILVIGG